MQIACFQDDGMNLMYTEELLIVESSADWQSNQNFLTMSVPPSLSSLYLCSPSFTVTWRPSSHRGSARPLDRASSHKNHSDCWNNKSLLFLQLDTKAFCTLIMTAHFTSDHNSAWIPQGTKSSPLLWPYQSSLKISADSTYRQPHPSDHEWLSSCFEDLWGHRGVNKTRFWAEWCIDESSLELMNLSGMTQPYVKMVIFLDMFWWCKNRLKCACKRTIQSKSVKPIL